MNFGFGGFDFDMTPFSEVFILFVDLLNHNNN